MERTGSTNNGQARDFLEGRNGDLSTTSAVEPSHDHGTAFESANVPPSKKHIHKQEHDSSSPAVPPSALAKENSVDKEFRDLEENSSNALEDSSEATSSVNAAAPSRVKGKVRAATPMLNATKGGAARKNPQILGHKEHPSLEEYAAVSPASDTSTFQSPGAVPVQGIAPYLETVNDRAQHRFPVSNARQNESVPAGLGNHDDKHHALPSIIVTARLVDDDALIEEDVEKRIQEGVESRLRTGTVLAEEVVSKHKSTGCVLRRATFWMLAVGQKLKKN